MQEYCLARILQDLGLAFVHVKASSLQRSDASTITKEYKVN